jgi:hypothetical protein
MIPYRPMWPPRSKPKWQANFFKELYVRRE